MAAIEGVFEAMTMQWHKPQIETIMSIDEMIGVKLVAAFYEDCRPGKEGRRAPMTLVNEPSVEKLRELFDYDPETGELRQKLRRGSRGRLIGGRVPGTIGARSPTLKYRFVSLGTNDNKTYLGTHNIAWAMIYGVWPEKVIDHKNGNGLDNRISNLREATSGQNSMNSHAQRNSVSKFKGVYPHVFKSRWAVEIGFQQLAIYIGLFLDERDAALHYDAVAKIIFKEFAKLNFPPEESEHVILSDRVLQKIARLKQGVIP